MEREGRMKAREEKTQSLEREEEGERDGHIKDGDTNIQHGELSGQVFVTELVIAIPGTWAIGDKVFR